MRTDYPVISVLVLCFNNQKFIYENLKSVFSQTYPNIEILIADDASDSFEVSPLFNWINRYRTPNITKVAIYENPYNFGTVKSLEHLQQVSTGEFLFNIAADDAMYDENVLLSLYNRAMEVGNDAEIVMADTEMWDSTLTKKMDNFMKPETVELLKNGTSKEMFAECAWHPIFPACYLYRRTLLSRIGSLSDKYTLIEDWPLAVIATRMGIRPVYCDIPSTIKHRDGGISHGNSVQSQRAFMNYYMDLINVFSYEVEPYQDMLSKEEFDKAKRYKQDRFRAYYKNHIPNIDKALQKDSPKEAPVTPAPIVVSNPTYEKLKSKAKYIAYKIENLKTIFATLALLIVAVVITVLLYQSDIRFASVLCLHVSLLLGGALMGEVATRIFLKKRKKRQLQEAG